MSVLATAATVYGASKTAVDATKAAVGSISDLMTVLDTLKDRNISALSAYTKRTLITSRVYVEDQLAQEDITPKLLKMLNSMYTGFVFCALGMNNMIASGKTVREMTNPVATEAFVSFLDKIKNDFGDLPVTVATEANAPKTDPKDKKNDSPLQMLNEKEMKEAAVALFTGRLLEIKIPDGTGAAVPIYFYVQLLPNIIPSVLMEQFVTVNTDPSKSLRLAMWKAGEISFWKDFIMESDRVAKRAKALKADKEGILREMEDHRQSSFMKKLKGLFQKGNGGRHNDANTIIICTQRTMDKACRDIGINIKNYTQRQNMMNNTMSVMICVVDTDYGTVNLYMNGIEGRGEYSAKMIDSCAKTKDGFDVKDILTLISAGSMPRF